MACEGRRLSLGGVQGGASARSRWNGRRNGMAFLSTSTTRCAPRRRCGAAPRSSPGRLRLLASQNSLRRSRTRSTSRWPRSSPIPTPATVGCRQSPPNLERAKLTVERIIRDANSAADVVEPHPRRVQAIHRDEELYGARRRYCRSAAILWHEEAARHRVRIDDGHRWRSSARRARSRPDSAGADQPDAQRHRSDGFHCGRLKFSACACAAWQMRSRPRSATAALASSSPSRIFEPFFTTKHHGMGMGLAICRSIIDFHGGRLWTEKNEPQGATFVFTLPVEAKAAP